MKRIPCKHFFLEKVPDEELGVSFLCHRCGRVLAGWNVPAYSTIFFSGLGEVTRSVSECLKTNREV